MKIKLIGADKAVLIPTGGKIRDKLTNRLYGEVSVKPSAIWRYEDADSVMYEIVDLDTIPEEVREVFDQVVGLIVNLARDYGAMDALRSLEQVNIASLFGLANRFDVDEKDMQNLIMQVVMLKTDIEAKVPRSWYDLWNGNLKPYLLEKIMTVTRSTN